MSSPELRIKEFIFSHFKSVEIRMTDFPILNQGKLIITNQNTYYLIYLNNNNEIVMRNEGSFLFNCLIDMEFKNKFNNILEKFFHNKGLY